MANKIETITEADYDIWEEARGWSYVEKGESKMSLPLKIQGDNFLVIAGRNGMRCWLKVPGNDEGECLVREKELHTRLHATNLLKVFFTLMPVDFGHLTISCGFESE